MTGPLWRRRLLRPLVAFGALAGVVLAAPDARADSGVWGPTGAYYSDGVLCTLGSAEIPLASWTVNGAVTAYALADISRVGEQYGSAPVSGAPYSIGVGVGGISGTGIGAAAYLMQHHASGPAAVAETSTEIAVLAGSGTLQQRCLGQGGTSGAAAATALAQARRFGGPYTVSVGVPARALPGQTATLTATVLSATGTPTPGIEVSFSIGGSLTTATSGSDGRARTSTVTPASAVDVTATVSQATSLVYYATSPPSVAPAAPTPASGTAVLQPAPPPHPVVAVRTTPLVLNHDAVTPVVALTGTNGYSGNGEVDVAGPVAPRAGATCDSLGGGDFADARTVWNATFAFRGDGEHRSASSPALSPGCYAASAKIITTNSTPAVRAASPYAAAATVEVSSMQVAGSSAVPVAPAGALSTTVTATDPGSATVTTTVVAYGPLTPHNGSCAGLNWAKATSTAGPDAVPLTADGGGSRLVAHVAAAPVHAPGCYALAPRSVVTQDGRTATVRESPGGPGATTLVTTPSLQVTTSSYGGQQGSSMTGTVQVLGTYRFPGVVRIGLRASTATPTAGCDGLAYESQPDSTTPTQVRTTGDGTFTFRTPTATRNRCYAITATLTLTANPAVRADSPAPSTASVFLAGAQPHRTAPTDGHRGSDSSTRTAIAFVLAALLLLALAGAVVVRVYRSAHERGELGDGWRPYREDDDEDGLPLVDRPRPGPAPSD